MATELNDSIDDIFGAPSGEVRTAFRAPAGYEPDRSFVEGCGKCRGTGQTRWGTCFKCKGAGKKTFKTSPDARAAGRDARVACQANAAQDALEAFQGRHPEIYTWLRSQAPQFEFAASQLENIQRFGSLTEGQLAACQRGVDRNAAWAAEKNERVQAAPQADSAGVERLKISFDKAIAVARSKGRGLKMPKITIGSVVISPAKETSTNPGALYIKDAGEYIGKITSGRFFGTRECRPDQEKRILAFVADPKAAAEAYGIETGVCCICNAELTNKVSIARGIGPICAENFGW